MRRRGGFAVVLVVALLAGLVLLLVALAALARSETRALAQRAATEQARGNALVGLRVALGRLQSAAGPDARTTARAHGTANPFWTGVWSEAGAPVWLVSGNPGDANRVLDVGGPSPEGLVLVGNATVGAAGVVRAPYENLTQPAGSDPAAPPVVVGRFAYWIGDEGVKAHVGLADRVDAVPVPLWPGADDPVTSAAERDRLRQLLAHRSGNDALNTGGTPPGGFRLGAENEAVSAERWGRFAAALTLAQLRFQELETPAATAAYRAYLREHHHAFTVVALGLLADAAHGGLRRNLSDLAAPAVPAAVKDLERYRPAGGSLPLLAGAAPADEACFQVKPVITEWALDFVPFREPTSGRLLVGGRLRVELWNPYNLPLQLTFAGGAALCFRIGGQRSTGATDDTGLPVVAVQGAAGAFDLRGLLAPDTEITPTLPEILGPRMVTVVTAPVAQAWDSGLVLPDATPLDPADDVIRCTVAADPARMLRLEMRFPGGEGAAGVTTLAGFPSPTFERTSAGAWTIAGGAPFATEASATDALTRLGFTYHWRLRPERDAWQDWIEMPEAPDLRGRTIEYAPAYWDSVAENPGAAAPLVSAQFAGGELFTTGEAFAAADFTVQRNLSIAALAQLSAPGAKAGGVGQPWGGARNEVFDFACFNPVPTEWRPGDRLPNVRHRVLARADGTAPTAVELGGIGAARFLGLEGAFNVNSVVPEAWTIVLGRTVLGWTDATGAAHDLENPYFTFGQSAPFAPAHARGVRCFSDAAIQALAGALVERIAARPRPFRSLAEFVNSGVLQTAIDAAGLNTRPEYCADIGAVPARWSANYLTQAAVLNTLAPVLTVRSDTFTIRVGAEALNPALPSDDPDRVVARAWCEAVVQRLPDYVDPVEDAAATPPLRADNILLGRRFRVVSFRWLGPDDI